MNFMLKLDNIKLKRLKGRTMKINTNIIEEIVTKKWKNGCPMCGGREWEMIPEALFTPVEIGEGMDIRLAGKIIPTVPIVCKNCGFVAEINALSVGAVDKKVEKEEGNETGQK